MLGEKALNELLGLVVRKAHEQIGLLDVAAVEAHRMAASRTGDDVSRDRK